MATTTPLERFLPYQLSITSNAVSERIALEYRSRWGVSVPEWRVMAVLGDAGPLTQRDLTSRTLMDKVAVNRACKVLEDRELASRTPNALDGRSHLLELTSAGKTMHSEIMPLAMEMERRVFAGFSPDELAHFRAILDTVRTQAEDIALGDVRSENFGIR